MWCNDIFSCRKCLSGNLLLCLPFPRYTKIYIFPKTHDLPVYCLYGFPSIFFFFHKQNNVVYSKENSTCTLYVQYIEHGSKVQQSNSHETNIICETCSIISLSPPPPFIIYDVPTYLHIFYLKGLQVPLHSIILLHFSR